MIARMTNTPQADQAAAVVAARIHSLMWAKRVTQGQLAGLLGVTQGVVSRKLRGHSPITLPELFTIAGALGVDVTQLVDENGPGTVVVTVPGPAAQLPRLDSNQQPSGYASGQVSDLAAWRASRPASGAAVAS